MSGKDEEPERDVPVCPRCGRKPDFWILYPDINMNGENGWHWLFSDKYVKEHTPRFKKMEAHHGFGERFADLDNVIDIVCRTKSGGYHHFKPEDPTFQKVLQQVRRLKNERNRRTTH